MINNEDIFGLVGVNTISLRAQSDTRGRGAVAYNPLQNWADKGNIGEGSSIGRSNLEIRQDQMREEGRELYEDYLQDTYGDDWQEESKLWGFSGWDDLSEKDQLSIARQFGAGLNSIEQSNIRRGMEEIADDRVREQKEEQAKEDREKKHEEMFKGWTPPPNQVDLPDENEKKEEDLSQDEQLSDNFEEETTRELGGKSITQSEFRALVLAFNSHRHSDDGSVENPYG